MAVDLVHQLEESILKKFQTYAAQLAAKFPNVKLQVCSHSVGSTTDHPGDDILIDCLLPDTTQKQVDNIALSVSLYDLAATPKINADVVWGHPSGYIEAEFYDAWLKAEDWPEVTAERLEELYKDLPRLFEALEEALARGYPKEDKV